MPGIGGGLLSLSGMVNILASIRNWEADGHYAAWEHERTWDR